MTDALSLEEQAVILSDAIRSTKNMISKVEGEGDVETFRQLSNLMTMQNKALTEVQRAINYSGNRRKRKDVTQLTEQVTTGGVDAPP